MKLNQYKTNIFILLPFVIAGCSLVNAFDDVVEEPPGNGDGDGDGDADGGTDMGGASGGQGPTGGESMGGDQGTGGIAVVPDGLVIAIEHPDPMNAPEDKVLYALSPQDGAELKTEVDDYLSATHEAKRDLWFFVRGTEIVAARFDRAEAAWEFLTESSPTVVGVTPFTEQFFALNDRIALRVGTKLNVYDTSDPSEISFLGDVEYPVGTLWGAAAATKAVGGNVNILTKNCASAGDVTCPVELTSIAVTQSAVQVATSVIVMTDFPSLAGGAGAAGNIRYDLGTEQVIATVPNTDSSGNVNAIGELAEAYLFSPDTLAPGESFPFQQPGKGHVTMAIDPCFSVGYVMSANSTNLSGFPFSGEEEAIPLFESAALTGRRVVYEPHTRSLILVEDENADFGLDAYSLTGTDTMPDVRKRITDWSPPTLRPKFVAVADTEAPLCD